MSKGGAYISDVELLEGLIQHFRSSTESISNIDNSVVNYLNHTFESLQRQLDSIESRLRESEQRLSQAQSALSACEAAASIASAMGMMCPTCLMEEQEVEMARMEVEKWRMRYDQGKQIVEECRRDIGEYNSSNGGHGLIANLCNNQTPKAILTLQEQIDILHKILSSDMGTIEAPTSNETKDKSKQLTKNAQFAVFRKGLSSNAEGNHTQNENSRIVVCPTCGRPLQLCICKNHRKSHQKH